MMKKNVSKPAKKLAVLLLVPALAIFLWAFAKPEYQYSTVDFSEKDAVVQDSIPQNGAPLLIVNGKEKAYNPSLLKFGTATEEEFAATAGVKADDIEEITVLKDKAATQIYGEKGKNGVILITTKAKTAKGKDERITINLNNNPNPPLLIVDDKIVPAAELKNINQDNIESMDILKESAADIYGEKGKNGVIIIRTKK